MSHWNTIDTNWDDPNGWGKSIGPFLDTLHPITGNLVEYALREQHCYQYEVVRRLVEKSDARIRKILESCEHHDPKEFNTRNYSKEEIARVIAYVRNVTRIFQMYYQVGDEDKWRDPLPCFIDSSLNGFNVGQLGDILNRIENVLEQKFTRHCRTQVAEQDVRILVALMDVLERDTTTVDPEPPAIEADEFEAE